MKIAIAGYGNLGKEVEKQALVFDNIELVGIFTRRNTVFVKSEYNTPVYSFFDINKFAKKVDVMLVCMGSENDLPVISPYIAKYFNLVDCYEIQEKMQIHKELCDKYAKEAKKLAVTGCGLNSFFIPILRKLAGFLEFPFFDSKEEKSGQNYFLKNKVKDIEGVLDAYVFDEIHNNDKKHFFFVSAENLKIGERIKKEILSDKSVTDDSEYIIYFKDFDENYNEKYNSLIKNNLPQKYSFNCFCDKLRFEIKGESEINFTASIMLYFAFEVFKRNNSGNYGCKAPWELWEDFLNFL